MKAIIIAAFVFLAAWQITPALGSNDSVTIQYKNLTFTIEKINETDPCNVENYNFTVGGEGMPSECFPSGR